GRRHGKPVVLKVKALEMYRTGYAFFLSDNEVWLTDCVPTAFIEISRGSI
ncbi:MAG: RNA 2'-phosphotransferase, partial [Bacteroidota bacterium]